MAAGSIPAEKFHTSGSGQATPLKIAQDIGSKQDGSRRLVVVAKRDDEMAKRRRRV